MLNVNTVKITHKLLNCISEIEKFSGRWSALEEHTTALQLLGDVAGFGQKFSAVAESWREVELNEGNICKLYLAFNPGAGDFSDMRLCRTRDFPLVVQRGDEIIGSLQAALPDEIKVFLPRLCNWANSELGKAEIHPLLVIALFIGVFLQICPFEKGNQKMARLLSVLLMFRAGYNYAPYQSLDNYFAARAEEYYVGLVSLQESLAEGKPDWTLWLDFFFAVLADQQEELRRKMGVRVRDLKTLPQLSRTVLQLFQTRERLSMKDIERLSKGNRSTLKLRLAELVEGGYLVRHGQARSTWYSKL